MNENQPLANPRRFLPGLLESAVGLALPSQVLPALMPVPPAGRTAIGAGNAASAMTRAVEAAQYADASRSGVVVTRHRVHCILEAWEDGRQLLGIWRFT